MIKSAIFIIGAIASFPLAIYIAASVMPLGGVWEWVGFGAFWLVSVGGGGTCLSVAFPPTEEDRQARQDEKGSS